MSFSMALVCDACKVYYDPAFMVAGSGTVFGLTQNDTGTREGACLFVHEHCDCQETGLRLVQADPYTDEDHLPGYTDLGEDDY